MRDETNKKTKKQLKVYPIGFFYIDITEVHTAEGKLYLFVGIDRTSKFVVVKLFDKANTESAKVFLEHLTSSVPYKTHTILTDNGIQFADLPKNRNGATALLRGHPFDRICKQHGVEHRLTKLNHPWTNGQVERMNRTVKDANVNRYYYQSNEQLEEHLNAFIMAYNFAKQLKTLKGLSPFDFIVMSWGENPDVFIVKPHQFKLGLYT